MDMIKQINKHRSIRKYKSDLIPDQLLQEILAAGIRTSSSGNMQTYSIIITSDMELRKRLLELHHGQTMILEAPALITFCADFHRMRHWLDISKAPDNFDNFFSFMVAAIDAILASQTVAIAAESKGLGICYLGSTLANCDEIGSVLELPEHVIPVVGFTIGYPAENPEIRDRLPANGLIHNQTYQVPSAGEIQDIYSEREVLGWERYMKSKWLREQAAKNGVENLAQLYTTVKYKKTSFQEYSQKLLSYLEEQGFMNNIPG